MKENGKNTEQDLDQWVPFNINNKVRVKLTRAGIHHYYAYLERFGIVMDGPQIDQDGWHETQLWCLMEIWGERVMMGGPMMFKAVIQLHSAKAD